MFTQFARGLYDNFELEAFDNLAIEGAPQEARDMSMRAWRHSNVCSCISEISLAGGAS